MTIIERIMMMADDQNIRKPDLYKSCNIPQSTFSSWTQSNSSSIPSEYVVSLARFFGITCDELLTGIKPMTELTEVQQRLIEGFDKLDWDGQQIVLATMISEKRRMAQTEG